MHSNYPPALQNLVRPNLGDYDALYAQFSWDEIRQSLDFLPDGKGLNIGYEAVDRHAEGPHADRLALCWVGKDYETRDYSYADLKRESNRFAQVLRSLGVGKSDRVFMLSGRLPELYIAAIGILKNGSVFCPLFAAFGPEPIWQRLSRGDGKVLVTTLKLYERKIAELRPRLEKLDYILLIDADEDLDAQVLSLPKRMAQASPEFDIPPTDPEDMALLHFTSGTTGMPKGAIHVHKAIYTHYLTGKYVLDLQAGDVFWCTADPGWVTGTSYGIIAPLSLGVTNIIDAEEFDAERWYKILEMQRVNVWYTAPTAIRRLMRMDLEPLKSYDLQALRLIHSVGEPLNPEAIHWALEKLNMPILDNWWQSETGGIMIGNYAALPIRPGSMGKPLPGIEAAIVRQRGDGTLERIEAPGIDGDLALKPGWPSMFRGYLHEKERYEKCFVDGWYLSGDLARRDEDGYFWFVGRADDIIKTSGHMVGPFEVESALLEHPAVAEAAVIGIPHPVSGQVVKAFVALKPGHTPSEALKMELMNFSRKKLGPAVSPKEIEFQDNLPKTRSGKIMRRLLKARELGLPEGDLSTLETH